MREILGARVARQVADDHTVNWDGNRWGVPREEICAGLRGAQVDIGLRHGPAPASQAASPSGLRPPVLTAKQHKSAPPNHGGHFNMVENRTFYFALTVRKELERTKVDTFEYAVLTESIRQLCSEYRKLLDSTQKSKDNGSNV